MLPDSDKNSSDLRQQRLAMLRRPVSLPLKLSSGDLEIPFSLLGSCFSQPCWRKADGRKGIHQAWKLCLIFCNSSFGSNHYHFRINRLNRPPPQRSYFHGESAQFYSHRTIPWPVSVCAHQSCHHPSAPLVLATSALPISGLPGTKRHILTARHNGLSPRQMPCHILMPRRWWCSHQGPTMWSVGWPEVVSATLALCLI